MQNSICRAWLSAKAWREVCRAATLSTTFKQLPSDIAANLDAWKAVVDSAEPQHEALPCECETRLAAFDKMLVMRMLRPDKLIPAVRCLRPKARSLV
jgi:dynein heavy chain, axonemal